MIRRLEQGKKALKKENRALQNKPSNRSDVPILFCWHYNFGRDNVVDLSRLISMDLENKPSDIDRDQIHDCVCLCFTALKIYGDNPEY